MTCARRTTWVVLLLALALAFGMVLPVTTAEAKPPCKGLDCSTPKGELVSGDVREQLEASGILEHGVKVAALINGVTGLGEVIPFEHFHDRVSTHGEVIPFGQFYVEGISGLGAVIPLVRR